MSLIAQLSPHRKSICFHKPHKNIATKIIAALTYDKPYDSFRHLRGDEIRLQVVFFCSLFTRFPLPNYKKRTSLIELISVAL